MDRSLTHATQLFAAGRTSRQTFGMVSVTSARMEPPALPATVAFARTMTGAGYPTAEHLPWRLKPKVHKSRMVVVVVSARDLAGECAVSGVGRMGSSSETPAGSPPVRYLRLTRRRGAQQYSLQSGCYSTHILDQLRLSRAKAPPRPRRERQRDVRSRNLAGNGCWPGGSQGDID